MNKIFNLLYLAILLVSCGGGSDSPPTPENSSPTQPSLNYPTNNLLCIDNIIEFKWTASSDPDNDLISYEVQIAKDRQFSQIIHSVKVATTQKKISLEKGIEYFWRVKAIDSKNASSNYSTINQFYTEGDGVSNHLPFSPVLISPVLGTIETGTTANLQWSASDVDTGDTLTFDVYFGTVNPPTALHSANISETNLVVNLAASTNYYWKVIVKDNNEGQTIGQDWNFKTD